MFWKHVKRNLNSLRVKAMLGFGLLMGLFFALCLVGSLMLIKHSLIKYLNHRSEGELKLMQLPYITALPPHQRGHEIPESEITPQEHAALREKFPGGKLLFAFARGADKDKRRFFYLYCGNEVHRAWIESGETRSEVVPRKARQEALRSDFRNRVRGVGAKRLRLRLYDPDGNIVPGISTESPHDAFILGSLSHRLTTFDGYVIEATCSTSDIRAALHKLFWTLLAVFAILFAVAILCGWLMARRLLHGVGEVSEAALRISRDGDFDCRVSARGGSTEITDLVDSFNTMNSNNRKLFNEVRSVTDNVAHELKTPLTRLRGAAELTLGDRDAGPAAQELAAVVSEESGEMLELINSMLEITRTESGLTGLKSEPVDLVEELRRAHELFLPVAEDLELKFELELPDHPVRIDADRVKLQRVFSNLIDNALKFNSKDGKVTLRLETTATHAVVTVTDSGCGIAEDDLGHIFERLYRCDASRSRPGNGLGLTLAQAIVRAHGGEIRVASTPGEGSAFTVLLPLTQAKGDA